ncbi:MAG: NUDIX domain-containing protein [Planctomycetaceae bacterium]
MNDELFDVVDENDTVLCQLPRPVVHKEKRMHRAVHIFVFRSAGKMLIHKRTKTKEEFPDVWTASASGHVSAGEDYDIAAPRELCEELGVTTSLTRLHKFSPCPDTCNEHTVLYRTTSDEPLSVDENEIAAVEFLTLSEIHAKIERTPEAFSPAFRLLFRWFRNNVECSS